VNKWCRARKARLPFERTFAEQINRMKHALLLALLSPVALFSQLPFDLTVLEQPYAPLLESTALDASQYDYSNGWDDPEFSVPLGFDFNYSGYVIDALDQVGVGSLMMGTTLDDKSGLPLLHGFIPTNFDLADNGMAGGTPSLIRWQTTGEPGAQVFTMEWAGAGLYEEVFADSAVKELSSMDLQLRLYEADGVIEFHFGPSSILTPLEEPAISGLLLEFDPFSYSGTVYALDGNPADPTIEPLASVEDWYYGPYLLSHPVDGTVYRFGPTGTTLDVTEARATALQAWPNPTAGEVNLAFTGEHTWTVLDATGRVVMHGAGQDGDRLDLSGLDAGAYTVRLDNGAAQRVVKH